MRGMLLISVMILVTSVVV